YRPVPQPARPERVSFGHRPRLAGPRCARNPRRSRAGRARFRRVRKLMGRASRDEAHKEKGEMNVVRASKRNRFGMPFAAAIALLALAAVATAQQITAPKLTFDKYTLPNGLTVILHEEHSTPIVAVNLWYHVGSKNEEVGRTGFAHLFEHMRIKETPHND